MSDQMSEGEWAEYKQLMLSENARISAELKALGCEVTSLRISLGELKTRISMWASGAGLFGGAIAAAVVKMMMP